MNRRVPVGAKLIGDAVYRVEYQHASDGREYFHDFKRYHDVQMYGLPDGSVLLVSRDGARLHETFTVRD